MPIVYFAPARIKELKAELTLPAKLEIILKKYPLEKICKDKVVAVKIHLGGNLGYTTIHPLFVRKVVEAVKKAGGQPFLTDIAGYNAERGYTAEVIGCPIYPAGGMREKYFYTRKMNYRGLKEIQAAGFIADSDVLINLSHIKGHGNAGFGGALKNLGMGAVTGTSRMAIHSLVDTKVFWIEKKCKHCNICVKNCRTQCISFKDKKLVFNSHDCVYCMRCATFCPEKAIKVNEKNYKYFQEGLARAVKEILRPFPKGRQLHINFLMNITPVCDCMGFSLPAMVPDVGIMASEDIVAVESATLDYINKEKFIEGSLPDRLNLANPGKHLFEKLWGKDPYIQVKAAEKLKLGSMKYKIVTV